MNQSDALQAIDKLMQDLDAKIMEYSASVKRDDKFEIKKEIRLQLKEIEKQIAHLKDRLTFLTSDEIPK